MKGHEAKVQISLLITSNCLLIDVISAFSDDNSLELLSNNLLFGVLKLYF